MRMDANIEAMITCGWKYYNVSRVTLCWCVWMPVRESLCLLWRETHTKGLRTRSPIRRRQSGGESRTEKREELNSEIRLLIPVDLQRLGWPTRGDKSVLVVAGFMRVFARVHARVSSQNAQKVSQTSPFLALGANQSPCLFVCLFVCSFPSTLSVVFCVSVKKCEIPLAGDEKNYETNHWPLVV